MGFKRSRMPINIFELFSGNIKNTFENVFSTISDDIEGYSLSNTRKIKKGVCLSGLPLGVSVANTPGSTPINGIEMVDLGDGTPRAAVRFRLLEETYGTDSKFLFTDVIPSPFGKNLSETERQRRVALHPVAYTEISSKHERNFVYGQTISLKQQGDKWFIISVFGDGASPVSTGGGANNTTNPGAQNSYSGGVPVPTITEFPKLDPAATQLPASSQITSGDSVLIFGDSQTEGKIGIGVQKYFESVGATVDRVFKRGAKPSYWHGTTGWPILKPLLEKRPKLVVITLGGNGTTKAVEMIDKVIAVSPGSKWIWIGAPPPAIDGTKSKPGKTWDYSKKYPSRERNNAFLQSNIASKVTHFVNPYNVSSFTKGYKCAGQCDGIHVPGSFNIATIFLKNAGVIKK